VFELLEINWYRYGMRSDRILQFTCTVHTALSSCNGISHTCLSLPSQSVHAVIVSFMAYMHEISFAGFTAHEPVVLLKAIFVLTPCGCRLQEVIRIVWLINVCV